MVAAGGIFLALFTAWAQGPEDAKTWLHRLEGVVFHAAKGRAEANSDPLGYGFDLFFYVNWPASPANRGRPDPQKSFGGSGPVVWETWKNTSEVYLTCGGTPPGWRAAEPVPEAVQNTPVQPSDSGGWWQHMTSNVQANGLAQADPSGQDLLYEIRMNPETFGYVRKHGLYNVEGQVAFAKQHGDLDFAFDALEAKSAWRWLDGKDTRPGCRAEDYFTANAYYPKLDNNGKITGYTTGLMGLTGLHILTKAVPQWVWITFEQKNNEACVGVQRQTPLAAAVVAENRKRQPILDKAGKWKNYMMVGVQTSATSPGGPVILANTQIESAFQLRSSCITCHGYASVATSMPTKPEDNLRKLPVDLSANPPYPIGALPSGFLGDGYRSMDFVWSLRRANRRSATCPAQ